MKRYRIRFGIRLGWPIANAATFVSRRSLTPEKVADTLGHLELFRVALRSLGPTMAEAADRLILEFESLED